MASKKQTKKTTHRTLTELERKFKGMFVWWNVSEFVILMSIKNSIWLPKQIMPFNYTPCNEVVWGYTGFTMSVRPSVSCLLVKRGGSLSFLTIFAFAVPELLDLISRKIGFLAYVV
jgi:hypothetical protein